MAKKRTVTVLTLKHDYSNQNSKDAHPSEHETLIAL